MIKKIKGVIKNYLKRKNIETFNRKEWLPFLERDKKIIYYELGLKKTKQNETDNLSKQLRFYSLTQLILNLIRQKKFNNGNFVECGCWKGHSSYVISNILKKNNFKKNFYIFDSFEGGLSSLSLKVNCLCSVFLTGTATLATPIKFFFSSYRPILVI